MTGTTFSDGPGTLEFETIGSSLKLFWNNVLVASVYNTTLTTGSVGVRATPGAAVTGFQVKAVTLNNPGLPFSDNFSTSSDGAQLDLNWVNQTGNFQVAHNAATATGTGVNDATVNGLAVHDVAMQAGVTVAKGQTAGLVARYSGTGDQNMDYAGVTNLGSGNIQLAIYRNVGGTWTLLAKQTITSAATGTLLFDASGSSLTLSWNSNLEVSANDSENVLGSVGLRATQGAIITNFSANVLP